MVTVELTTRRRIILWSLIAAALVGGGTLFVWRQWFQTYHFAVVQPGVLYRDGVRSMREFETATYAGNIRTVVSLVDHRELGQEPFRSVQQYCYRNSAKMRFMPIAISLGGWPSSEDVRRFLDLVTDKKYQPVLVHCAQGVRRTGMMVAAYQLSVLKYDKAQARQAILPFGHSQRTVADIETFIDAYDPVARSIPTTLPAAQEKE